MGTVLVVAALVTGVLALAVVATMVVENHGRIKVDLPPRPPTVTRVATTTVTSVVLAAPEPSTEPLAQESVPREPASELTPESAPREPASELTPESAPLDPARVPPVAAPLPEAPTPDQLHVIEGRVTADQLVATLFASYAASRGPEANRAAAWVTSIGWPPQVAGGEFRPGADLRGKPAAVARVLRCDSEGRSWLTLNTSVDIGRGLRTRPPRCPVLAGVADLWASSRAAMSELPAESLGPMIDAITELEPQWRGTPMAPEVLSLLVALTDALDTAAAVRLQVTNAPVGRVPGPEDGPSSDVERFGALHDAGARSSS